MGVFVPVVDSEVPRSERDSDAVEARAHRSPALVRRWQLTPS
jgi:hypothetical protein